MKKALLGFCVIVLLTVESQAQFTRFIIRLKDKGATTATLANPSTYLSTRAIERRSRYNIAIDSSDLPVPPSYINQIKNIPGVVVLNVSKWLNAVAVDTTDPSALAAIEALPFVQSSQAIAARLHTGIPGKDKYDTKVIPLPVETGRVQGLTEDYFNYGTGSYNEIHLHNGEFLHNIGLRGQGMQIAMLDGGFQNYTTVDGLDSIITNGQVLSTWDFVNRESSVVEDHPHGMMCLSTIAANLPGQFVGKAPKASFHLFRTEDAVIEYPIEEFNWVCGAERADSSGADVISSSVGYNTFDNPLFNHSYNDLNGNTAMITIGADMAAKKGILVFQSAGNDGTNGWHYINAPSDGDSVIAVGAVNASGAIWTGTSYGPSFDGRIKPDMASVGWNALVQNPFNVIGIGTGTSYAAPSMAGLGTILWQGFPEVNNMRIARALREAGSIYSAPNDRIGYGVPDLKAAFTRLLIEFATSAHTINNCDVTVNWQSKDVSAMNYELERKIPGQANYTKIATIGAQAGNTLSVHNYSYVNTLTNVPAGNLSYRIRQIIDTAAASFTAAYIDTVDITLSTGCNVTSTNDPEPANRVLGLSPNPASNDAVLVVQTSDAIPRLNILIHDMKGRLILKMTKSKGSGKATIDLPVSGFAKGKYVVTVYDAQQVIGSVDLLKL